MNAIAPERRALPAWRVFVLHHLLDRAIARGQDLHLCAVVDHLRAAQTTLTREAEIRLKIEVKE